MARSSDPQQRSARRASIAAMRWIALASALGLSQPAVASEGDSSDVAASIPQPAIPQPAIPSASEARSLIAELLLRLREDRLDARWLTDHLDAPSVSTAPDPAWVSRWLARLAPDRPIGRMLRASPGVIATLEGPDYQRLLVGPAPGPSFVVRATDKGSRISELSWTACALCPERTRFVVDLIADIGRRGRAAGRLLPGIELDLRDHPASGDWVSLLQQRNSAGEFLAHTLRDARVTGQDGEVVTIRYPNGLEDQFRVRWHQDRWQIDYTHLVPTSPLRLSWDEAARWRDPSHAPRIALRAYEPSFEAVAQVGLNLGYGAVDAWPDPRNGTVVLLLMDLDRIMTAIVRVDPETHQVIDRWPVRLTDPRTQLPIDAWSSRWPSALTDDGRTLAVHSPGHTWIIDIARRSARLISRGSSGTLGWSPRPGGAPDLLLARGATLWRYHNNVPIEQQRMPAPVRAAWWGADEGLAVCDDGQVIDLSTAQTVTRVCCGRVTDAVADVAGAHILATCGEPCDVAGAVLDAGASVRDLVGAGTEVEAASLSPNGRWLTTGQDGRDGSVLLWGVASGAPEARVPVDDVRSIRWSHDSRWLITVETHGRVVWWPIDDLLSTHAL